MKAELRLIHLLISVFLLAPLSGPLDAQVPPDNRQLPQTPATSRAIDSSPCGAVPVPPTGWRLAKELVQLDILRATQSQQTYKGEILAVGDWRATACGPLEQRTRINLIASYDAKQGTKPGSIVNRVGDLRFQHLVFGSDVMRYVSANADTYHNTSLAIYLQQAVGIGVGRVFNRLELSADVRAVEQRFYDEKAHTLVGTLLGLRYSRAVGTATIVPMIEVLPVFNKANAWQARSSVSLIAPLNKSKTLGLTVTAVDDYVDNVPARFRKNYLKIGVGVQFSPAAK